ncbi:hypothetical protein [Cognaticolwellia mytili]|uniref:hypothetical protein n=1 Tax=Cognaticolwellia mytili TaxID=1888913 RepID=UPI000A1722B5|nr:hypothetical protein [Cognaticolwellia mytili]
MVTQSLLWQSEQQSSDFAELCNALYERELSILAMNEFVSVAALQGRVKSLPHYVKSAAHALLNADTPLDLDIQNASWSAKQTQVMPSTRQLLDYQANVLTWYKAQKLAHGLVVPIATENCIVLDCIDRVDTEKQRFRTNVYGWFSLTESKNLAELKIQGNTGYLLKPSKKVMTAACVGHCWKNSRKVQPIIPSLRELLLSCAINWRNFKQPIVTNN